MCVWGCVAVERTTCPVWTPGQRARTDSLCLLMVLKCKNHESGAPAAQRCRTAARRLSTDVWTEMSPVKASRPFNNDWLSSDNDTTTSRDGNMFGSVTSASSSGLRATRVPYSAAAPRCCCSAPKKTSAQSAPQSQVSGLLSSTAAWSMRFICALCRSGL